EGVLRPVGAAEHASAAADAPGARRTLAVEIRIGHGLPRRTEEDRDFGGLEALGVPSLARDGGEDFVGGVQVWIASDAQHRARGGVVRGELLLPIGQVTP